MEEAPKVLTLDCGSGEWKEEVVGGVAKLGNLGIGKKRSIGANYDFIMTTVRVDMVIGSRTEHEKLDCPSFTIMCTHGLDLCLNSMSCWHCG